MMMLRATTHRGRTITLAGLIGLIGLVGLIVVGMIGWWLVDRGSDARGAAGLETHTVQAGAVEVQLTPLTLDDSGAVFELKLDTHTVSLDLDPATAAQLRVNGAAASAATWEGQGPGGHHREGTLRFTTAVPTHATVALRINGLPRDATATWTAP